MLTPGVYKKRLIDAKIERYLRIFGALCIEGPKWCGKTWTALHHADTVSFLTERSMRELASVDPKYIFQENRPQLLDEWQLVPSIWDAVRHECDRVAQPGQFILTGSTSFYKTDGRGEIFHSGTGRIAPLRMQPMSLFESGDSDGSASLTAMRAGTLAERFVRRVELSDLAGLIVRGGWPANLRQSEPGVMPASYLENVITTDIHERRDKKRDSAKMRLLIRSLARHESTLASLNTLVCDIEEYQTGGQKAISRQTISDYLGILDGLYLTANQPAFSVNYRSSSRVGKTAKRHLVDPSLAAAALHVDVPQLLSDHETFGLLFEALVVRDLRIYLDYLGGHVYHFRDSVSGDEVDAIIEFADGQYAAIEVKLSDGSVASAKESLLRFAAAASKKPLFMCVIVGHQLATVRDPQSGIYIVPATSLAP